MTTFTVANQAGLQSAFNSATGGDTIVLKDGYYGGIKVTADYGSTVTVRAEGALDATIGQLTVSGGTNIKFDGIKFDSGSTAATAAGSSRSRTAARTSRSSIPR